MKTVIVHEAIFSSTQQVARVVAAALADAGADVLVTEARTTRPDVRQTLEQGPTLPTPRSKEHDR